jgi:oligoribonuclease
MPTNPSAPPSTAPDDRLVWLDLEMTGLDVTRHVIVEIAALVTDGELEPLDDGIDVIVHQPPAALAEMDDFVQKMHTRSGLVKEIEASTVSLADAGAQALEYIRRHVPDAGVAPMCGNSIGVDRRFLDHQRPHNAETHRALADVRESIAELRYYREHMLKPGDAPVPAPSSPSSPS